MISLVTFYTKKMRKSTGGIRCYEKGDEPFFRMEMVLRRRKIVKNNLSFPLTPAMFRDLDIDRKLFKFVRFDHKGFKEYILRNEDRKRSFEKITNMNIDKAFQSLKGQNVLYILERLRGAGYPVHQYLVPYQNENAIIRKVVEEQCFGLL